MDVPHKVTPWGNNYKSFETDQLQPEKSISFSEVEKLNPLLPNYSNRKVLQSEKMGITLMLVTLSVAFLSVTAAIVSGFLLLGYSTKVSTNSYHIQTASETMGSLILFVNVIIGTIIGITMIVLSIITIIKNKGRSYAILALIIAVITPIIGFISFSILFS